MIKKFKMILTAFVMCFLMVGIVHADASPATIVLNTYYQRNTPISFPYEFYVKKSTGGLYVYCMDYDKKGPYNHTYAKKELISDPGINYIMADALKLPVTNDDQYFIYQTALWIYMAEEGLMGGSFQNVTDFRKTVNNSSSSVATHIKNLVNGAKQATSAENVAPSIKIADTKNVTFKLSDDKKNYVSSNITVSGNVNSYNVSITSGPEGTTYTKGNGYINIVVPANKVSELNTEIKFSISGSKDIYNVYMYTYTNTAYQKIAIPFKDTKSTSASSSVKLVRTAFVDISKQDITSKKELSGASLQLTDKNGKIIDSWTSGTTPHRVANLSAGTYTLTEKLAPNGYVLSEEKITFTIDSKGRVLDNNGKVIDKVVMYNELAKGGASISKQDITDKAELSGAHLQVKDSEGKVIDEWISEKEPHVINNLKPGEYTLIETKEPDGYTLSKEEIKFTVKGDGSITKVVMYNEPAKGGVSISKQDITNKKELPGASLVVKDYDGKVIDEWVSSDKPHVIENLKPGTYTLTETLQPDGYILSSETITFTVKGDGSITKVVMYNEPASKDIVEVENTASFKTITSSVIGLIVIAVGLALVFKNKKVA